MRQDWNKLPEKFLQRLDQIVPKSKLQQVLEAFCTSRPTTFRANTLKITPEKLEQRLTDEGIHFKKVPWIKGAYILVDQPQRVLTETTIYKEGYIYVQSLSSMLPPLVLDPLFDERVLDIAAAPGSKTSQMAAMMQNTGEIVANDTSRVRIYKLEANLKLQDVRNTKIIHLPGQIVWKQYPEYFDKSLVDVPCSMEGRISCNDPKSYLGWSTKKIEILQNEQKYLLRSAVSATKIGGEIVYSTCTLAPEENEEVIDWILKKEGDALKLEPIKIDNLDFDLALLEWKDKRFNSHIAKTARVLPSDLMEGFYIAKIKKVKTTFLV